MSTIFNHGMINAFRSSIRKASRPPSFTARVMDKFVSKRSAKWVGGGFSLAFVARSVFHMLPLFKIRAAKMANVAQAAERNGHTMPEERLITRLHQYSRIVRDGLHFTSIECARLSVDSFKSTLYMPETIYNAVRRRQYRANPNYYVN